MNNISSNKNILVTIYQKQSRICQNLLNMCGNYDLAVSAALNTNSQLPSLLLLKCRIISKFSFFLSWICHVRDGINHYVRLRYFSWWNRNISIYELQTFIVLKSLIRRRNWDCVIYSCMLHNFLSLITSYLEWLWLYNLFLRITNQIYYKMNN